MEASQIPKKFSIPWAFAAGSGYLTFPVPTDSQIGVLNGAASFTDGFPPLSFVDYSAGGAGPFGADFNGIMKMMTLWLQWSQAGGAVPYDSTFQNAIGGYPKGAIVSGTGSSLLVLYQSQVNDNMTDPSVDGVNWLQLIVSATPANFYVRTDGSDDNNGLSNSAGGAFRTIAGALSNIQGSYNITGRTVTITLGQAGTYDSLVTIVGIPSLVLKGLTASPSSYQTGPIFCSGAVSMVLDNIQVNGNGGTSTDWVSANGAASVVVDSVHFDGVGGGVNSFYMSAEVNGNITVNGPITGNQDAGGWLNASANGSIDVAAGTSITFSGTPAWSNAGVLASSNGNVTFNNNTSSPAISISGSCSGAKGSVAYVSTVINGTRALVLPGDPGSFVVDSATFGVKSSNIS